MTIPKPVIFGVIFAASLCVGWLVNSSTGAPDESMTSVLQDWTVREPTATAPVPSESPPVYLTVMVSGEDEHADLPAIRTGAEAGAPTTDSRRSAGASRPVSSPAAESHSQRVVVMSAAPPTGTSLPAGPRSGEHAASAAAGPVPGEASEWRGTAASPPGLTISATGDHIVIAADGSIVSVGDNTVVRGNTGDAHSSGVIAVDVDASDVSSGSSNGPGTPEVGVDAARRTPVPAGTPGARVDPADPRSGVAVPPGRSQPDIRSTAAAPPGVPAGATGSRAVAVAGWENHAVDVVGHANLVTYDDSNLFVNRVGNLNANTGDTDTSGLNVVDSVRSRIRSGDSGDSDESQDPPPYGQTPRVPRSPLPVTGAGSSASVADLNGTSTATAHDSLVIGGDGVDDNGVRVHGDRNVTTYDDGNVAVGGIGNANFQVGDSDTGGAVVMGVVDSDIAAGSSFLPWYQQAGEQVSDPFDGDDPDVS